MIFSPLLLAARRLKGILLASPISQFAAGVNPAPEGSGRSERLVLSNDNHKLEFDVRTARLMSLRAAAAPEQEFVPTGDSHPVFAIQYLDSNREYQQVTSVQAKETRVLTTQRTVSSGRAETALMADFTGVGGFDLSASVTVRSVSGDRMTYWSIAVRNGENFLITDVQFPFIIVSYQLTGAPGTEAVLQPYSNGRLFVAPQPRDLEPDSPHAWQFRPESGNTSHYPGNTFAQFLAFYNDRAGVYLACNDTSGAIKLIKPVHSHLGIRLGIAHVGDWPTRGERKLEYDVVVQTFTGDWYSAAELYRDWSLRQHWAERPLHKRTDVPDWLLDSPPHIIARMQGELDAGPGEPNPQFLPYRRIVPLLENISKKIEAPVTGIIMSWERPGPWIYPDCFPPVGGDESVREFTGMMRDRGWRVGSFCNGTRWVVHHFWTGYDGRKYFTDHDGAETTCKTHDQDLWREWWDQTWRPSYACCLDVPKTKEMAGDFIRHLAANGLDWIQFLDQNVGCSTFPCYANDHGRPPYPGRWMTAAMQSLINEFRQINVETAEQSGGTRKLAFSVEQPPNEYFMSDFQVCDARVIPPGHTGWASHFIPLYHFLYHEFVLIQGGFDSAPEPYHMPIRSAYNLVTGEIPGGVITGDGLLLNYDTFNWAPWQPPIGNNDDSLEALRTATALRRGKAKEFLVFGRMQRPADVHNVRTIQWQYGGEIHRIPAVFHSAWESPRGRFGIVLANWTKEIQTVRVSDRRLETDLTETISSGKLETGARRIRREAEVALPPLSSALLEPLQYDR
ncbi:MAG: DUF6259 domain-containing protein [Terriglobia bacterium]